MTMSFGEPGRYVPVVPGPLDTAAIWGASKENQVPSEGRPHLSPGRPPWEPEPEKGRGWTLALVVMGLLFVVAGVFGFIVQRSDVAPYWVPLVGKDSGVAACEALAAGDKLTTLNAGDGRVRSSKMTELEYLEIRSIFGGSRHEAIRTNGEDLIDYAWQLQALGNGTGEASLMALPLLGSIMKAYSGLSGGCSEQGITIPAFGSK